MRWFWLPAISLGLLLCGCSKSPPGERDPDKVTTRIAHTAGGGSSASPNYRARISIGVPQPCGDAEGSGKILKLGVKPSP